MSDFNLPEGWIETSLDSISSDVSYGYTAKSTTEEVGPHLLRITDIQDNQVDWRTVPFCVIEKGKADQYLLKADDLVFARTGATVGKSFLIKGNIPESVFASYLIRVRSVNQIGINYLAHFFNSASYWNQITEFSSGIGQPNVNGTKLKELILPLAPLAEQQQIAQKLDELLAQVDTLKTRLDAIPSILKRFRQSVLAAAVSGRLTEEWRGSNEVCINQYICQLERVREEAHLSQQQEGKRKTKNKEVEDVLEIELPKIPEVWIFKSVSFVTSRVTYGLTIRPSYIEDGVPIISAKEIRYGVVNYGLANTISHKDYNLQRDKCKIYKDDVLFSKTGTIGHVARATKDTPTCSSQNIAVLTPIINSKFLELVMRSPFIQKLASDSVKTTAIPDLQLGIISRFPVPLTSIEEQTEIVRRVEQLFAYADQIEQRVKDAQARVNHLTQSILAKAFRGELTADWRAQNPDLISGENSAAALLERIKAEREVVIKQKRKGK